MSLLLAIDACLQYLAKHETSIESEETFNIATLKKDNMPKGVLSYNDARAMMYGYLDNVNGCVSGIYTGKTVCLPYTDGKTLKTVYDITDLLLNPGTKDVSVKTEAIKEAADIIRSQTYENSKGINCEHVWPQSALKKCDIASARCDLHHLYPAGIAVNGIRSDYPFHDVDDENKDDVLLDDNTKSVNDKQLLQPNKSDFDTKSEFDKSKKYFEPREVSQGNIARSIFYVALMYGDHLFDEQRFGTYATKQIEWFNTLRKSCLEWNKEDAVDQYELERCGIIQKIQGNVNPFVIHPEAVDAIFNNEKWLGVLRKQYT